MNQSQMLHQMCHSLLAATDAKALCKARGLAPEAITSPGILETLFLSPQGVDAVLGSLEPAEIGVLHLLRHYDAPVDIRLFWRAYGKGKTQRGTFNQRFQPVFTEVKQRMIRQGVLLWAEGRNTQNQTKLELFRFALPIEFHGLLPRLLPSPRSFKGDGDCKPNVARDKLIADLGMPSRQSTSGKLVEGQLASLEAGELKWHGKSFESAALTQYQQAGWRQITKLPPRLTFEAAQSMQPDEAALAVLSELAEGEWADVEQIDGPLRVFSESSLDAVTVCDVGWQWGLLAKRKEDGKLWYRLLPQPKPIPPQRFLNVRKKDDCVAVDLSAIPLEALQQLVAISDQEIGPEDGHSLLLKPSFLKFARAADPLLASEPIQWLIQHSQAFSKTFAELEARRGQTILHEELAVARVRDLSLKVAVKKLLGPSAVSLKNDYIAFPLGQVADVQRLVKKSGHVVKEVATK